jgi:hypothetical protein
MAGLEGVAEKTRDSAAADEEFPRLEHRFVEAPAC